MSRNQPIFIPLVHHLKTKNMKAIFLKAITALIVISFSIANVQASSFYVIKKPSADSSAVNADSVQAAINAFKHLSHKERKELIGNVKEQLKSYKEQKKNGSSGSDDQLLLIILAILLPPLAVYLHEGEINTKFWLDLLLTLLFFLPGVIYALIVVLD
jgi:uncharacterized membrane protein YqaE (UPF0057 family)